MSSRSDRFSTRAAARLATAVVVTLVGLLSASGTATATAARTVTAAASATDVIAGTPVTITGRTAPSTVVVLERRIARKWVPLRPSVKTVAAADGTYTLSFPTNWYLTHRLRVRGTGKAASNPVTVVVRPAYAPTGSATSWKPVTTMKARWNPCKAISWRVNPTDGYAGAAPLLAEAFAEVARATGLRFAYRGTTAKDAGARRPKGHADILIDWKTPQQDRFLTGTTRGYAETTILTRRSKQAEITTSDIVLDQTEGLNPEDFSDDPAEIEATNETMWRDTILHELVHAIGLGHVNDPTQLMYPSDSYEPRTILGAGDLAGLRTVGASRGCMTNPLR